MTQNAFVRTYDLPASMAKFVILWTDNPEEDFREALELAGPYDYEYLLEKDMQELTDSLVSHWNAGCDCEKGEAENPQANEELDNIYDEEQAFTAGCDRLRVVALVFNSRGTKPWLVAHEVFHASLGIGNTLMKIPFMQENEEAFARFNGYLNKLALEALDEYTASEQYARVLRESATAQTKAE